MNLHKKRFAGFTLIELLIALSILGLLVATVALSLPAQASKARDARRKVDIEQIRAALELFRTQNGFYPIHRNASCGTNNFWKTSLTAGGFISEIPNDPLDKTDYKYVALPDADPYAASSTSCCRNGSGGTPYCTDYEIYANLEVGGSWGPFGPNDVAN